MLNELPNKLSHDEVSTFIENFGYKLVSDYYENATSELEIKCDNDHVFNMTWASFQQGRRCHICKSGIKLTFEQVKNTIEDSGCELLSETYVNSSTKLKIRCNCSNVFYKTYNSFNTGNQRQCRECGIKFKSENKKLKFEDVRNYIETFDYKLLSTVYTHSKQKLTMECPEGHTFDMKFNAFKNGRRCSKCSKNKRMTFEEVEKFAREKGCSILSEEYNNASEPLEFVCQKHGHIFQKSFTDFRRSKGCPLCSIINNSGENNYGWRGGVKPIYSHLRSKLYNWKKDSLDMCNNKCIISNSSENIVIHHLYGFELIFNEVFETTNIPIKQIIGDYDETELKSLENVCNELHGKYPLGVCLTDELHDEFHSMYGYGKNTPKGLKGGINVYVTKVND
jgi:hypothetical protein